MIHSLNIAVDNEEMRELQSELSILAGGLQDRTGMNEAISKTARQLTRDHLIRISDDPAYNKTADRLGATRSGHWAKAGEERTTADFDENAATVSIADPGIGRVARDITIKPLPGKEFLALPAIAEAYGSLARTHPGLVAITSGDKGVLMMPQKGETDQYKTRRYKSRTEYTEHDLTAGHFGTVWYYLVKSVFLRQDRSLLPSDEEYGIAALEGVRDYMDYLMLRAFGKGAA